MQITITISDVNGASDGQLYDLLVDGRLEISGESWTIVDGVRAAFRRGIGGVYDGRQEVDEIAESILGRIVR